MRIGPSLLTTSLSLLYLIGVAGENRAGYRGEPSFADESPALQHDVEFHGVRRSPTREESVHLRLRVQEAAGVQFRHWETLGRRERQQERAGVLVRPRQTQTVQFRAGEAQRQHRLPGQAEPGLSSGGQSGLLHAGEPGRFSGGEARQALRFRAGQEDAARERWTADRLEETERLAQPEIPLRPWQEDARGRGGLAAIGPIFSQTASPTHMAM